MTVVDGIDNADFFLLEAVDLQVVVVVVVVAGALIIHALSEGLPTCHPALSVSSLVCD